MRRVQQSRREFRFSCGHVTSLPRRGHSTPQAYWNKNPKHPKKGLWRCGCCMRFNAAQLRRGKGSEGLVGWAKLVLRSLNYHAQKKKYCAPRISLEGFLILRQKAKRCALTNRLLDWSTSPMPHLHHNHRNGKVIGFVCGVANRAEGQLAQLTRTERKRLVRTAFPELFDKESE